LEAIGLLLILVSVGWQIFLEDPIATQIPYGHYISLNEQLVMIWMALGSENTREAVAAGNDHFWLFHEPPDQSVWHLDFFTGVRAALFSMGTILAIASKWFAPSARSTARGPRS
jgi:hypothetical protein